MDRIIKGVEIPIVETCHIIRSVSRFPLLIQNQILQTDDTCITWKLLHKDAHGLNVDTVDIFIAIQ